MHERERAESVASERAVLARLILPDEQIEGDPLEELDGLATTAVRGRRDKVRPGCEMSPSSMVVRCVAA